MKKINYLVQMASIKKDKWRMQSFMDKGFSLEELEKEESKLWKQINKIVDETPRPLKTCDLFSVSKLIGHGWEWAVYSTSIKNQVVKVPAGIFLEVNNPEYLNNTEYAYRACQEFIAPFLAETTFERRETKVGPINMMFQKRLSGKQYCYIDPKELSLETKKSLIDLGQGLLEILKKHSWMPDVNLYKKELNGRQVWSIWNLMLENEEPRLIDFTAYYDVFRLYPERTKQEIKAKKDVWQEFLTEISP